MTRQLSRFEGRTTSSRRRHVEVGQDSASIEIPAELKKKLIFNIDGNGVVTLGLTGSFLSKKQDDLKSTLKT